MVAYSWEWGLEDTVAQCGLPLQLATTVFAQVKLLEDVLKLHHLQNNTQTLWDIPICQGLMQWSQSGEVHLEHSFKARQTFSTITANQIRCCVWDNQCDLATMWITLQWMKEAPNANSHPKYNEFKYSLQVTRICDSALIYRYSIPSFRWVQPRLNSLFFRILKFLGPLKVWITTNILMYMGQDGLVATRVDLPPLAH